MAVAAVEAARATGAQVAAKWPNDLVATSSSHADRKVAGVAGGLGRHLDVDPLIIRVLFVVLVFFGGSGLLVYGVMWLFVPDEATGRATIHSSDSTRNVLLIGALVLGAIVTAVGIGWEYLYRQAEAGGSAIDKASTWSLVT